MSQVSCSGPLTGGTVFLLAVSLSSSGAEIRQRQSQQPSFLVRDLVPRSEMSQHVITDWLIAEMPASDWLKLT